MSRKTTPIADCWQRVPVVEALTCLPFATENPLDYKVRSYITHGCRTSRACGRLCITTLRKKRKRSAYAYENIRRGVTATKQSNMTLSLNNFCSDAGQVKLWNVETKECAMAFKGHNAEASIFASELGLRSRAIGPVRASRRQKNKRGLKHSHRCRCFHPQEDVAMRYGSSLVYYFRFFHRKPNISHTSENV